MEEIQRIARKSIVEKESGSSKAQSESFENELKETIRERKKANRPMSKEEVHCFDYFCFWENKIDEVSDFI